jgi:hypothetical protein
MSGSVAFRASLVLLTLSLAQCSLAAEPAAVGPPTAASERVTLSLQRVPLRAALEQLYRGAGVQLSVDAAIPDAPVTGNLTGIDRAAATRILLRWTGLPRLTAKHEKSTLTVTQDPEPQASANCGGSVNVGVDFSLGAPAGNSVGPGGAMFPNYSTSRIRTFRRVPVGQPTFLGGFSSSSSFSGSTFVTIRVLPEPEGSQ